MKKCFLLTFLFILLVFGGCRDQTVNGPADDNQPVARVEDKGEFISPAAGDVWLKGSTHIIEWKDFDPGYKIHLILLKKKQYYPVEILTDAPNIGVHTWKIPEDIVSSTYYQIKLVNSASPDHYIYSSPFVIR